MRGQGATACALPLPFSAEGSDPGLVVARQWSALEAEQRRLILDWKARESWLFEPRNWPRLSEVEQAVVPEGAPLQVIDAQLHDIDKVYDALLPRLKTTSATTREAVFPTKSSPGRGRKPSRFTSIWSSGDDEL